MPPKKSPFIVIEGTDGSGKTEQTTRLASRIRSMGHSVSMLDFPRYGQPSAWFVSSYLNGDFGTLDQIGPKLGSLFYALDRFAAKTDIASAIARGDALLSNRYVASNLAHQGSKYDPGSEQDDFFRWNEELEYEICGIPRPDINIVLFMPPSVSQRLVGNKAVRPHLEGKTHDLHESNADHLQRTWNTYQQLVARTPDRYIPIQCADGDNPLPMDHIHELIWEHVKSLLEVAV